MSFGISMGNSLAVPGRDLRLYMSTHAGGTGWVVRRSSSIFGEKLIVIQSLLGKVGCESLYLLFSSAACMTQ